MHWISKAALKQERILLVVIILITNCSCQKIINRNFNDQKFLYRDVSRKDIVHVCVKTLLHAVWYWLIWNKMTFVHCYSMICSSGMHFLAILENVNRVFFIIYCFARHVTSPLLPTHVSYVRRKSGVWFLSRLKQSRRIFHLT